MFESTISHFPSSSMPKESIYLPYQSLARLAVNRTLSTYFPQLIIEKSASFNGGFYTVCNIESPINPGFEKELERLSHIFLKENLLGIEEIEMHTEGASQYFEKEGREAERHLIAREGGHTFFALRVENYVDPWPYSELPKANPKSLSLHIFDPIEVNPEILKHLGLSKLPKKSLKKPRIILRGLAAEEKKSLSNLVKRDKRYQTNCHAARAQELFLLKSHHKNHLTKRDNLLGYTQKGIEQVEAIKADVLDLANRFGAELWKPMDYEISSTTYLSPGTFKIAFYEEKNRESSLWDEGVFAFQLKNRVQIEGLFERKELTQKVISSLQLIESLFKLWGIEVKKELVSCPDAFAEGDLVFNSAALVKSSRDVRDSNAGFNLLFIALDGRGTERQLVKIEARPQAKKSSMWNLMISLCIDDALAIQIES